MCWEFSDKIQKKTAGKIFKKKNKGVSNENFEELLEELLRKFYKAKMSVFPGIAQIIFRKFYHKFVGKFSWYFLQFSSIMLEKFLQKSSEGFLKQLSEEFSNALEEVIPKELLKILLNDGKSLFIKIVLNVNNKFENNHKTW